MATPLIYPGGKTLLLPHIRPLVPPHDFLLDLFGGGGAFVLDDTHRNAVYNDINGAAVNFFRVMRDPDKWEILYDLLRRTPYSRREYYDCDTTWKDPSISDIERARRWFVVINMGFTHEEDNHSFLVARSSQVARAVRNHVEDLPQVHEKLRNVVIEELDFRRALDIYGKGEDALIFADPPYLNANPEGLTYQNKFTPRDHWELLQRLNATDAQVILCGYDSDLYHSLLRPPIWELVKKVRIAQVGNSDYTERDVRVEHIWVKKSHYGTLFGGL